jgi:hypothetical protein
MGVKQPQNVADHFSPYSAKVKIVCSCTSIPPYIFLVWFLIKQRGIFFKILNQSVNKGISKSFQTSHPEQELQMVQLFATRCSYIVVLWVSQVSFTAMILCVASHQVFIIVVIVIYFIINSVWKLLDTPS